VEEYCTAGQTTATVQRMRMARWITKFTKSHSEYVIFIAFLQQQWLLKRAWMLSYSALSVMFIVCFVGSFVMG
jgi:hypothetical protein